MLGHQPRAELEQRLTVTVVQLVEDRSARGCGQGMEDVRHLRTIGKRLLACQVATITSRRRGPWTPSTRSSSMSEVADGPDTKVIGASWPRTANASGTDGTMSSARTMQTW